MNIRYEPIPRVNSVAVNSLVKKMRTEGFQGKLEPSLAKAEVLPALTRVAPLEEDEVPAALQLNFKESTPVVISFYEFYRFLDRLVSLVFEEDAFNLVLVRIKMPSNIALPLSLLDERVVIFHDVDEESEQLIAEGKSHVLVDADFKLYSWSAGTNHYSIKYISNSEDFTGRYELSRLRDVIATLPATISAIE